MFLHYNITSFPGHFDDIVKKLEEANGGEGGRDLAGSGGVNIHSWEYTFIHCYIPLCYVPYTNL